MVEDPGYSGYVLADRRANAQLKSESDTVQLAEDEFLPFGDNTQQSLDGRFFGGVAMDNLIGPAFAVYWPFGERWGFVK